MGGGRGDRLNIAIAAPGTTEAFFLSSNSTDWVGQVDSFKSAIRDRSEVWLTFSITRGVMGEDKSGLYKDFIEILESEGFSRRDLSPSNRAFFHAVWTKLD